MYDFAVHPSGKMALSVSKDRTLRTWNLMTAKCAYVTNIKAGISVMINQDVVQLVNMLLYLTIAL